MNCLTHIDVPARPVEDLTSFMSVHEVAQLEARCQEFTSTGRRVWHVNSTAVGGGVAEMLHPLVGYAQGLGVDMGWLVIEADSTFFDITKRVDNGLSGIAGDGGSLSEREHELYASVCAEAAADLASWVQEDDVVIVHDPQPAGLVPWIQQRGAHAFWRQHNGADRPNRWVHRAWDFLERYLDTAEGFAVTMPHFAAPWMSSRPVSTITPFIDPLAPKNHDMDECTVRDLLQEAGIITGGSCSDSPTLIVREGPPPGESTPMVVQLSRWDAIKDMLGVMTFWAGDPVLQEQSYLSLIGPAVDSVADDAEAAGYYEMCVRAYEQLPRQARRCCQLVCLPMEDPHHHARVVNACQRHAAVVVQKSISEGFGLTVTEAMWKKAAVVASAVGGIARQIDHGTSGLLVSPTDAVAFTDSLRMLLEQPLLRQRFGQAAHTYVRREFLLHKDLISELALFADTLGLGSEPA